MFLWSNSLTKIIISLNLTNKVANKIILFNYYRCSISLKKPSLNNLKIMSILAK